MIYKTAVILCGGKGSRFSQITENPKQLSLLNKKPLIMHIIDHFFKFGLNDFILPLGHKKNMFFNLIFYEDDLILQYTVKISFLVYHINKSYIIFKK